MELYTALIGGYLVLINGIGFTLMGIDKRRSIRKGWRISERTLLLIAFMGGCFGSFLGMQTFRHKTRHMKFKLLLPLAVLSYLSLLIFVFRWIF